MDHFSGDGSEYPVILIVDDENHMRSVIKRIIEEVYPHVHEAKNGLEALTILQNKRIDVVITDYMMPLMDGAELIKQVRESDHPNVPIILLTGSTTGKDLEDERTFMMKKPFGIEQLRKAIEHCLVPQEKQSQGSSGRS